MVLARNSSNNNQTYLFRQTHEIPRTFSLVNPCMHCIYATSLCSSKENQLKLRELGKTNSGRRSSIWNLCKNPALHTRNSWTIAIRCDYQHNFRYWQPPQSCRHFKRHIEGIAPQQKPLTIVNEPSSNRTNLDNKTNAIKGNNNIFLVNGILSYAKAAKLDYNY